MAVLTTQAQVDALYNKYFRALDIDGNGHLVEVDWPTDTRSDELAAAGFNGYKAKQGSLNQGLQDDLVDILDTANDTVA